MPRYVMVQVKDPFVADHLVALLAPEGISISRPYRDPSVHSVGVSLPDMNATDARCRFECAGFDALPDKASVRAFAVELVRRLTAILQIYLPDLDTAMSVYDVRETGPMDGRISGPVRISINDAKPFADLKANAPDGSSLLAKMLHLSDTNKDVAKALSLVQTGAPEWGDLYHVIEFFGKEAGIKDLGLATKTEVGRHKQTANHYRHLGQRPPPRLPDNPPTLQQSRVFVMGLLRRWLEQQP